MNKTVIWGFCADEAGIIRHCSEWTEKLPGCKMLAPDDHLADL